jgi:RND family efflux transporter MFP subunit
MIKKNNGIFRKIFTRIELKNTKVKIFIRITSCVLILTLGIIAFLLLSSISHKPKIKPPEQLLKTLITVPVNIHDYRYEFIGYGSVKPSTEIAVSSELKGHVVFESPELSEGNFVKKGTVLLKIDDIDYRLALKEAETQVVEYSVKIEMAEQNIIDGKDMLTTKLRTRELENKDYERKVELRKKDAISIRTVEDARKKLSEARHDYIKANNEIKKTELELKYFDASLERAKIKLTQAQKNLEKSSVKAPIDGRLENISVTCDEYVSDGSLLFEINNGDNISIDVPVEVDDALYLMDFTGESSKSFKNEGWFKLIGNTSVSIFWTGDLEHYMWVGKIVRIKKFNAETRTLTLNVKPTGYAGKNLKTVPLVEGMFCKIQFKGKTIKNTVNIPWAALQLNGKIFVVNKKNIVEERAPKILNSSNNEIIISSKGIKKGEHIVAQRIPQNIVNGTEVKILSLKSDKTKYNND